MRITVVTSYFPTSARPYGGNSAFQTLLRLKPHAAIEVVSPQEHYLNVPFLRPARYEPADLTWQPPEFETTYVSYPVIPIVSRPFNGPICAKILLPYVRMSRPDLILNYWLYPDGYAAVHIARELGVPRSEEHTSELQSPCNLVCRVLLEKKKKKSEPISSHDVVAMLLVSIAMLLIP